jgi:transposase
MVLFAGQFAPTSGTCSGCGSYQSDFSLKIRQWTCPACGAVHDRDENAANNIVAFATEVMRVEGDTDPIPKGAIPRTDRGLDEARTESLKPSTILPSEARKPREEQ